MPGVGSRVRAADYNSIQGKVALVLGSGSGNSGYGQALSSGQVSVGDQILVSQWNNLRTDLLKARQHQTGATESLTITSTSTISNNPDLRAFGTFILKSWNTVIINS